MFKNSEARGYILFREHFHCEALEEARDFIEPIDLARSNDLADKRDDR